MISAAFFTVLGVGLSPLVENVPGVKQVQTFMREIVHRVRGYIGV